jgi:L-threonylcarbamoyladenylate synthase
MVTAADAERFERCLARGGVALFPADTVYGLACDPEQPAAVDRLYALKGRPGDRPAAVMFFSVERALAALPELEDREQAALRALLPGPVTLLVPNREERFPLACGPDRATLGLRVPRLDGVLSALGGVGRAALQSSANASGDTEARRLRDVPAPLRDGADLVLDGGQLPGVPSTVVDLRRWAASGRWSIVREGALDPDALASALDAAA